MQQVKSYQINVNNVYRKIFTRASPKTILNAYRLKAMHDFHVMLDSGAMCGIFNAQLLTNLHESDYSATISGIGDREYTHGARVETNRPTTVPISRPVLHRWRWIPDCVHEPSRLYRSGTHSELEDGCIKGIDARGYSHRGSFVHL